MALIRRVALPLLLCLIGLFFLFIGGRYALHAQDYSETAKYVNGCIVTDLRPDDNSVHMIDLGQFDSSGNCQDVDHFQVGYQFTTSDLSPAFPKDIDKSVSLEVEIWYKSDIISGTCGTDQHSCQLATIVALRTYTLNNNRVVPGSMYKSDGFIVHGDLTQAHYRPGSATYINHGVGWILPVLFSVVGLLLLVGGVYLLIQGRSKKLTVVQLPEI